MSGQRLTHLLAAASFLRSIGLQLIEDSEAKGFCTAVTIHDGTIRFDPTRAVASDLLHEAGHLAVIPAEYRPRAGDNVDEIIETMCAEIGAAIATDPNYDPDAPHIRAIMQAGETEATAWAFAAGRASGLPDHVIIQDHDYDGAGRDVRIGLAMNAYLGINGLVHGGMCVSTKTYPALTRWLQD